MVKTPSALGYAFVKGHNKLFSAVQSMHNLFLGILLFEFILE